MQFLEHVIRDMARGARLAVEEDRNILVAQPHFLDEGAQGRERFERLLGRAAAELLVVDGEDETGGAALLLGERGQIAIAGDAEHLQPLALERLGERANAKTARVLGAEVLVDDDDWKTETHRVILGNKGLARSRSVGKRAGTDEQRVVGAMIEPGVGRG